ncbi:uncharacterized protein SPSK_02563 [Sporothrix schenckii 1099-18]|uniref:Uncharacterized protein n=1 Tax=Sporothrix schenckii 1099-18 TaxID=1397361 RepID=A0A0F2MBT2_SPOSC|nr:uncharacterized protein SPSK_02563 [Sporothrix schenckii 1099-18]KJR86524.1 hypothetical protein SPSK_02563 [Sporothrix schenckii 1099-18]
MAPLRLLVDLRDSDEDEYPVITDEKRIDKETSSMDKPPPLTKSTTRTGRRNNKSGDPGLHEWHICGQKYCAGKKTNKKPATTAAQPQWPPRPFTDRTGVTKRKIAAILCSYVQPDCALSEDVVANSILALIPEDATASRDVKSFVRICVDLAEQIPYHHPSQLKLARLLRVLGESPTFLSQHWLGSEKEEIVLLPHRLLMDRLFAPAVLDAAFPDDYVNASAFRAKLCAMCTWGAPPGPGFDIFRDLFETDKQYSSAFVKNTLVKGAAQWVLWNGHGMFSYILYDQDGDGRFVAKVGNAAGLPPFQARSVERWRYWASKFEEVGTWSDATDECKDLAARAARIMHALAENMVFAV